MSTILSDPTAQIARRLMLEREARGWSQADLAARAGVSRAMISKIERGEASPTATILGRLSGALEITMATLLARAEAAGGRLVKAADQATWRDPETGYVRRQVFARAGAPLELADVTLPPGARVGYPAASYGFIRQHLVWLMTGSLIIEEAQGRQQLAPGDCLEFGEAGDTAYLNPGDIPCRYLVALCAR
jgi:transcriptional regulator with XRE-family HTH domain